jgi:hypothetical protein
MSGEFEMDPQEVIESVESAEVLSLSFITLRKALVIDTRRSGSEGPLVRIMAIVGSPQERIKSIRRLRAGFLRVRSLTVIPWPRYVDSLVALGIWERILGRVAESGDQAAVTACEEALVELTRLEKAEMAAVVKGERYHTIWASGR